jgi:hypothetical protein
MNNKLSKNTQSLQTCVSGSFNKLLCKIGWHQFTCKMQDCIDEFGFIPNDGRMPKVSKCSRCGKNYR